MAAGIDILSPEALNIFTMFYYYIKTAFRSIRRKRIFSALNITGLAIGTCVFLLSLEYFSFETGYNRFHKNLSRLYRVNTVFADGKSGNTVPNMAPLMEKGVPGVKAAPRFMDNFNSGAIVTYEPGHDKSRVVSFREQGCVFVDSSFIGTFSFPLLEGTNRLGSENTVLVTASAALKLFGREPALGKIIELHNQFGVLPCEVTGVLRDVPVQSDIRFDFLFSNEILKSRAYTYGADWARLDNWNNSSYTTFVWLEEGADPDRVASMATDLWAKSNPDYKKEDSRLSLQPISQIHLGSGLTDSNPTFGSRFMVYLIFGLGILVLAMAWINYINFSTAHALSQVRQIGIQKIVGSRGSQIVLRYVTESILLNGFSLIMSFSLVQLTQGLFNYLTAKPLSFQYIDRLDIWLLAAAILIFGVLLCGGYVGLVLARFTPLKAIRSQLPGTRGSLLLRKGLVVFQFVISILFMACTIAAYKQVDFMKAHDLGMNLNNLMVVSGPQIRDSTSANNAAVFVHEMDKIPFIDKITATGSIPGADFTHNFGADGVTSLHPSRGDDKKNYFVTLTDQRYFDTYGIGFAAGRTFTPAEVDLGFKAGKVIINQTAALSLGINPLLAEHQMIKWNDRNWELLGVVKDYHHRGLKDPIEPILFVPQHNMAFFTLKITPDHFKTTVSDIKAVYEKLFPGNPFGYSMVKDAYNAQYAQDQRSGKIALSLSVLVIVIASLGLIGLSVFTARRRIREIGIRKILGASSSSLFVLMSREFLELVVAGTFIAAPIAWLVLNKWLQNFAYHVELGVWIFAASGLLAVLIALVTVSFEAARTALANPVTSLRAE